MTPRSVARVVHPVSAQWIRTCRDILRQVKARVHERLGEDTASLLRYRRPFEREFSEEWQASTRAELIARLRSAAIVLSGDFHAFHQSQRVQLRILRSLPKHRKLCLAVECVEAIHQDKLDAFMRSEMTEAQFISEVEWDSKWGFPFEHYRPLFEMARERGYDVLALNLDVGKRTGPSLTQRDQFAANRIAQYHFAFPETLVYVIYGELHLAKPHLPRALRAEIGSSVSLVTLFQNHEKIYFELATEGRELTVNVVRLPEDRFCILSTPPWIQWQSYLLFLEQSYDGDLENDESWEPVDYTEHTHSLLKLVSNELRLRMKMDDFSVFSPGAWSVFDQIEKGLSKEYRRTARALMTSGRSFFIPKSGVFYLGRATINHAAALTGHYLQARLSGRMRLTWRMTEDFVPLIWIEALAFFASKIINHQRKSEALNNPFRGKAQRRGGEFEIRREAMLLSLEHSSREIGWLSGAGSLTLRYRAKNKLSYSESARILGSKLGERLYWAYRAGKIKRIEIVHLFQVDIDSPEFIENYKDVVRRVRPVPKLFLGSEERL